MVLIQVWRSWWQLGPVGSTSRFGAVARLASVCHWPRSLSRWGWLCSDAGKRANPAFPCACGGRGARAPHRPIRGALPRAPPPRPAPPPGLACRPHAAVWLRWPVQARCRTASSARTLTCLQPTAQALPPHSSGGCRAVLRKTPRLRLGSAGEAPFAMSAGKAGSGGWVPTFPPPSLGPTPLMFPRMVGFFGGCPELQALLFAEGTPAKEGIPT